MKLSDTFQMPGHALRGLRHVLQINERCFAVAIHGTSSCSYRFLVCSSGLQDLALSLQDSAQLYSLQLLKGEAWLCMLDEFASMSTKNSHQQPSLATPVYLLRGLV
uniref:Uncharacterized protein n=1 Tax=Paracidobacterium acidisoli TaxID=2303751 RepID=A0A372IQ80_9BACT